MKDKTRYEFLPYSVVEVVFGDFSKCEDKWLERDNRFVEVSITTAYEIVEDKYKENYKLENALEILKTGRVISIPLGFIREKNDIAKCGLCGNSMNRPALSRRDNKTSICNDCGLREALEDVQGNR